MRTKLVNLQRGGRALKFKLEYVMDLKEIVCRVCHEINVFGGPIPVTRGEALTICVKQIQTGIGVDWDAEHEDDVPDLEERIAHLFPELK